MQVRRTWRSLTMVALVGLVTACGGAAPELSISVAPEQLTVISGSEAEVTVTLTRNETATDEVALSVAGLPEGVTATFEPATVPGTSSTSTLTFTATRESIGTQGLVTITATYPGDPALVATASLAVQVRGATIEGQVISNTGAPAPGTRIYVGNAIAAPDQDGRFTFENVGLPYDLAVETATSVEIIQGLTTTQPIVRSKFDQFVGISERQGAVEFALGAPVPADHGLMVCLVGPKLLGGNCTDLSAGETHVQAVGRWGGEATELAATLHLVEFAIGVDGTVTAYTGAAELDVTLTDNESQTIDALALGAAPSFELVNPTFTAPDWADTSGVVGFLKLGDSLVPGVSFLSGPPAPGAPVLWMEGAPVVGVATASGAGEFGIAWSQDPNATLTIPSRPTLLTPAEEYATAPALTFAAPAEGEVTAVASMYPTVGSKIVILYTRTGTLESIDLSRYGIPAGGERGSQLMVARGSGYASIDDVVGEKGSPLEILNLMFGLAPDLRGSGGITLQMAAGGPI